MRWRKNSFSPEKKKRFRSRLNMHEQAVLVVGVTTSIIGNKEKTNTRIPCRFSITCSSFNDRVSMVNSWACVFCRAIIIIRNRDFFFFFFSFSLDFDVVGERKEFFHLVLHIVYACWHTYVVWFAKYQLFRSYTYYNANAFHWGTMRNRRKEIQLQTTNRSNCHENEIHM